MATKKKAASKKTTPKTAPALALAMPLDAHVRDLPEKPTRAWMLNEAARLVTIRRNTFDEALEFARQAYPDTTAEQLRAIVEIDNVRAFLTMAPHLDHTKQAIIAAQAVGDHFFDRDVLDAGQSPRVTWHVIQQLDALAPMVAAARKAKRSITPIAERLKEQEDGFVHAGRRVGFAAPVEAWEIALSSWIPGAWSEHRRAGRRKSGEARYEWEMVLARLLRADEITDAKSAKIEADNLKRSVREFWEATGRGPNRDTGDT